jgi:hypothetical protein
LLAIFGPLFLKKWHEKIIIFKKNFSLLIFFARDGQVGIFPKKIAQKGYSLLQNFIIV